MRRLPAVFLALMCFVLATAPAGAQAQEAPPAPKAWIVVDAETGAVLDGGNVREPVYVASTIKLLTALIAVQRLGPDASVPVSPRAAAMPARKLNMDAGETWTLIDTLHALLFSSANDAAAALGERVGGSLEQFSDEMAAAADTLGVADSPVLRDPSGLDDENSVGGGNLVSARDLAVIARAALADPTVAEIVASREYRFTGPDGVPHHLINHNKLLSRYAGAVGMKTGYTRKSGHTLVAAAERDGRQVIAVVLGAVDMYGSAAYLLDKGFSTASRDAVGARLPPIRSLAPATDELAAPTAGAPAGHQPAAVDDDAIAPATTVAGPSLDGFLRTALVRMALSLVATLGVLRTRAVLRRSRRKRRQQELWRRRLQEGGRVPLPGAPRPRPVQRVG